MSTLSERRTPPDEAAGRAASMPAVTGAQLSSRFPPRTVASSWPLTETDRSQVVSRLLAPPFALEHPSSQQSRRLGVLAVVNWLQAQPGRGWHDRWLASGAEVQPDWRDLLAAASVGRAASTRLNPGSRLPHLSCGLLVLICADVIRPSLGWLLTSPQARRNLARRWHAPETRPSSRS